MTKHKDYTILESGQKEYLQQQVNSYINNGYVLIGGIATYGSGQNSSNYPAIYTQAVAKPVIPAHANTGPK